MNNSNFKCRVNRYCKIQQCEDFYKMKEEEFS